MDFGLLYELALPEKEAEKGRTEQDIYMEALEQIETAEDQGFGYLWAVEHHFLEDLSRCSAPEVFLAAASQRTETIKICHGVILAPFPFNHPIRTAERIGALDIVSGGRVEFGLGRSVTMEELDGFQIDPAKSRPMLEEVAKLLPKIWKDRMFEGYESDLLTIPPRVVVPKPIQKPHPPMWMACGSPKSFEIAGHLGLGALAFTTGGLDELAEHIAIYREAIKHAEPVGGFVNDRVGTYTLMYCAPDHEEAVSRTAGRAARHFGITNKYFGSIAQAPGYEENAKGIAKRLQLPQLSEEDLQKAGQEMVDKRGVCIGDPDFCEQMIQSLADCGVDQFLGVCQFEDLTHEEITESLSLFGREVIPRFTKAGTPGIETSAA